MSFLWRAFAGSLCFFLLAVSVFGDDPSSLMKFLEEQQRRNALELSVSDRSPLEELAHALSDLVEAKAFLTGKIGIARRHFWATYPNKPGAEQARTDFAKWLREKDIYYLQNMLTVPVDPRTSAQMGVGQVAAGAFGYIDAATGGKVDSGIWPGARSEFYDWFEAVRTHLSAQQGLEFKSLNDFIANPARVLTALNQSQAEYDAYLVARNWAEFDAAGREPAGSSNPHMYGALMYMRFEKLPWKMAVTDYVSMAGLMGTDMTEAVDKKVHAAPKDAEGYVANVTLLGLEAMHEADRDTLVTKGLTPVLGTSPTGVMVAMLGCCDARRFLLTLLATDEAKNYYIPGQRAKRYSWQYADSAYKRWVAAIGEPVLETAEKVRKAPKRALDGALVDPKQIGAVRAAPYSSFQDILLRNNPRGYLRAVLSFGQKLDTAAAIDAAYQKLISSYGEKAALDTAAKLAARSGGAASAWPHVTDASEMTMLTGMLNGSLQFAADNSANAAAPGPAANATPCPAAAPAPRRKGLAAPPTIVPKTTPCTSQPATPGDGGHPTPSANPTPPGNKSTLSTAGVAQPPARAANLSGSSSVPIPPTASVSPAMITGTYRGQYVCAQGRTGLRLDVDMSDDGSMKALFTAYLPGVPPTNPPAAYDLKGNYNIATKQFVLTPVKWESRAPAGYVMVGMSGTYDAASKRLSGKITNASCGAFDVTRE